MFIQSMFPYPDNPPSDRRRTQANAGMITFMTYVFLLLLGKQ